MLDYVGWTEMYKGNFNCTTSLVPKKTRIFMPLFKSLNLFPSARNNSEALI
jgi:hypothetical protein